MTKQECRAVAALAVGGLSAAERAAQSEKIAERLFALPQVKAARRFFVYLSFQKEADTAPLLALLRAAGKEIYAPRIVPLAGGERRMVAVKADGILSRNRWGIDEPAGEAYGGALDVAVVPGLAFSESGARLGRGAGCYDRFFAEAGFTPFKIGVCFEAQIFPALPAAPHDVNMDCIVTPERVILCGALSGAPRRTE